MKPGQFSVEYLLVVAFALLLMIPVIYYSYTSFTESQEEISAATVNKIGYQIINTARDVYFLGASSKVTLNMNFPSGIEEIKILSDDSLMIKVGGSEIMFPSTVKLEGTFTPENYNPGMKRVQLLSSGNSVKITIS